MDSRVYRMSTKLLENRKIKSRTRFNENNASCNSFDEWIEIIPTVRKTWKIFLIVRINCNFGNGMYLCTTNRTKLSREIDRPDTVNIRREICNIYSNRSWQFLLTISWKNIFIGAKVRTVEFLFLRGVQWLFLLDSFMRSSTPVTNYIICCRHNCAFEVLHLLEFQRHGRVTDENTPWNPPFDNLFNPLSHEDASTRVASSVERTFGSR